VRGKNKRESLVVGGALSGTSSLQPCTLFIARFVDRGEMKLKQTIFLSGDLTMGLDAVEIVMGWEESFGISIFGR